jgi:hypothetical protein
MFNGALLFNGNLDTWNTILVESMSATFVNNKVLDHIMKWNVSNCTNFSNMYTEANDIIYDGTTVYTLKASSSIRCDNMFRANNDLEDPVLMTNTASIDNHSGMYSFTDVTTLPPYDYSNSGNVAGMFQQANLQGTITAFNVPLTTSISDTFGNNNLTSVTGVVTGPALLRTDFMLSANPNLVTLGLFDTQNVTTARSMFANTAVTSLPAFNWSSCDNFTDWLKNVTLDTSNYDDQLEEIDSNGLSDGTLNGGNSLYSIAGKVFRDSLLLKNWTIIDGGAE